MTPKAQRFHFDPSARLQKYLGTELIADPNLAIIEFVKNSYDSGAANVLIRFLSDAQPSRLVIADDGSGMDEEGFERNWMHPGFSTKANGKNTAVGSSAAAKRQRSRTPAGEKGLGRLAAGRLGATMDVYTRRSKQDQWLHVEFDWSDFENMDLSMRDVAIPYSLVDATPEPIFDSGTVVIIENLAQTWDARIRGRPIPGRSRTRLGRLRQDLQLLVQPLDGSTDLVIALEADWAGAADDLGTIDPHSAVDSAGYRFDFTLKTSHGKTVVERTITRSTEVAKEVSRKRKEQATETIVKDEERSDGHPTALRCGPFSGTFFYNPPPAAKRAHQLDVMTTGVLLYRDGVLVEPYGLHGNDWVGVSVRKAVRQGHAAIQPNTFSGSVRVTRETNSGLRDMTNRLGLLENDASEDFLAHVRAEFREFEELVYNELVSKRWEETGAERAAQRAGESADLAVIRLRAAAHSIRQPLAATALEMLTVRYLAEQSGVPKTVRDGLQAASSRVDQNLEIADAIVERLANLRRPEFATVDSRAIVRQAVAEVKALAAMTGVDVVVGTLAKASVVVPQELVFEALAELLRNGIEAERPVAIAPVVEISSSADKRGVTVHISDNGTGIPDAEPGPGVPEALPTHGRPGGGLATVEVAIGAALGRIELVSSGESGTEFEVWLPSKGPAKGSR